MQSVILTSIISAAAAVLVVFVMNFLTRRREHEADRRKPQLDQYREYVAALSGITEGRSSAEAQRRYSDAVNALQSVASTAVLRAVDAFIDANSFNSPRRSLSE